MLFSKIVSACAITLSLLLINGTTALADTYIYDPGEVIVLNDDDGYFFGKAEFDTVGFNATEGSTIKLVVRHKLNNNDSLSEQWGVWFYDAVSGNALQIKNDPNHLLDASVDETGIGVWANSSFKLTKSKITDALYNNANDWWFILSEVSSGTDNTLKFDKAKLVVTPTHTPIPGALWLFGSSLALVFGARRRSRK